MMPEIPHLQFFDFLDADDLQRLLEHVAEHTDELVPSTVYGGSTGERVLDVTTRRSRVIMDTSEIRPIFEERLRALLPHLRRELGIDRFDFGSLEMQLTVHGDGDFFTSHRDEMFPGADGTRALTFVFYFNAEPREFEGGTLRLGVRPDASEPDERSEIEPVSNSIVFFAADVDHEVMPIRATGTGPGSLRCTFNGWYRIGKGNGPAIPPLSRQAAAVAQELVVPRVTQHGFSVRSTPASVQQRLALHWNEHRDLAAPEGPESEYFPSGTPDFLPIGPLGDEILQELLAWHEDWAGVPLEPVSAYGLRCYREGQRIAMHVDRGESHIITSELQIEQVLDRPWPLHLRLGDRNHDVHVGPGLMVTYEGASCPNGRPEPLQGSRCCSLLLHYRPVGWELTPAEIARRAVDRGVITAAGGIDVDVVLAD